MELCRNESTTAESIKEARAIWSHVILDAEAQCFATVKAAKVAYDQTIKKPRPPMPAPSQRPKLLALWPLGIPRPGGLSGKSLHRQHGKSNWDLEAQVIQEEGRSQTDFLSVCQAALHTSPGKLKGGMVSSYQTPFGAGTYVPPIHITTRDLPSGATV